jgi:hypothetical protein
MVCMNHGGLPMAALHGCSPPPYTFVTGNLNFLPKICQNLWFMACIHSKMLIRDPSPPFHPPSQPTTHRDDRGSTQSLKVEGRKPLGQKDNLCFRKGASQLNYMDI